MAGLEDAGEVFARIYEADDWDGGSGEGSARDATVSYREVLDRVIQSWDVRTVVDVGCGDWQLGELVDWSPVRYVGWDVVPAVVEANKQKFGHKVEFHLGDARTEPLPKADLLIAKDVLQHWPNSDIREFLAKQHPRYRYMLITNDISSVHWTGPVNSESGLGGWRTLDLEAPPFLERPAWRADYEIRGEWTKRMLLFARGASTHLPGSALNRLRRRADV